MKTDQPASLHAELMVSATRVLLDAAHTGSLMRWAKQRGMPVGSLASVNELLAHVYMQVADRFEYLMHQGCPLHMALNTLITEGWVARVGDLAAQQLENGRNDK